MIGRSAGCCGSWSCLLATKLASLEADEKGEADRECRGRKAVRGEGGLVDPPSALVVKLASLEADENGEGDLARSRGRNAEGGDEDLVDEAGPPPSLTVVSTVVASLAMLPSLEVRSRGECERGRAG